MYNVEAFLPKCIDSIRNQTLSDIEIILVDDGSPDKCGEIADEYAKHDARIEVIHKVNGGLGPARNSGMEIATGKYIGFVDSDDWIEPDMYERLYKAAEQANADIVYTGLKTIKHGVVDVIQANPYAGKLFCGPDEICRLRESFYGAPPAKVKDEAMPVSVDTGGYRRELIEHQSLRFPNVRSEDKCFNIMACRAASRVACISGAPYCYRRDDQPSITKTFNPNAIPSFSRFFSYIGCLADEEPEKYRHNCQLRAQRCIIDYSRVLIGMIEDSSETNLVKEAYTRDVMDCNALRKACSDYPWLKLPIQQGLFFLTLKWRRAQLALKLVRLKRGK